MMELETIYGDVIIALETAKTIAELVKAAIEAKKSLRGADLYGADLRGAKNAELAIARMQFIPEEGQFIGWKKCEDSAIVKLRIPADAKRSHGSERKCRCS